MGLVGALIKYMRVAPLFVLGLCIAGCRATPSDAPDSDPDRLSGNIDVRPFTAAIAYAHERYYDDDLDIHAFERAVSPEVGCGSADFALEDTERYVWVQMPWPVEPASEWWSTGAGEDPPNGNDAGVFFSVRRGHGSTATRATGRVEVLDVAERGGVLYLEVATENTGSLHGSVKGSIPFTICP